MFAANIGAIVGIQVLNKTSEEYWFLVKFNLSLLNGNMDLRNIKKEKAFFLIRLQIDLRLVTRYLEYRTLFLLTKRYRRQDQSKCSRSMNNTVGLLSNRRLKSNKRPSYDVMFELNAPCRTEAPPPGDNYPTILAWDIAKGQKSFNLFSFLFILFCSISTSK